MEDWHFQQFSEVMSVANSLRSLVWTVCLMLLMKYIVAVPSRSSSSGEPPEVYLCQLIADTGAESPSLITTAPRPFSSSFS